MNPQTYRAEINKALKPLGLKIQACAHNGGYSYFISLSTGQQVGDSVYVYRQTQLTVDEWVRQAKHTIDAIKD